ncbi:MAG: hypothetical protein AAGA54_16340 [Myxococcota bacterium]
MSIQRPSLSRAARSPMMLTAMVLMACDPPAGDRDPTDGSTGDDDLPSTSETTNGEASTADLDPPQPPTPTEYNVVFVTSSSIPADFGGLEQADEICRQHARDAGLEGTFVAWLSTSTTDALSRLQGARGWVRTDGRPFADQADDVVFDNFYPPALNEYGEFVDADVRPWTGTRFTGLRHEDTCDDWTSQTARTMRGTPFAGIGQWIVGPLGTCSGSAPLYCFSTDRTVALEVDTPTEFRRVFVANKFPLDEGGRASADQRCQQDADHAGLPGTYLALLPTATSAAADRFDLTGPTWVRADGIAVWEHASDLSHEDMLAPVSFDANGARSAEIVMAGASSPGALPAAEICEDWTTSEGEVLVGRSDTAGPVGFGGQDSDCGPDHAIYCLEQ